MKTSVLILIFSAVLGMSKCSSDLKLNLPGFQYINPSLGLPELNKQKESDSIVSYIYNTDTALRKNNRYFIPVKKLS
jgi:hypothetical protein